VFKEIGAVVSIFEEIDTPSSSDSSPYFGGHAPHFVWNNLLAVKWREQGKNRNVVAETSPDRFLAEFMK
jgi:hypothetical protein